VFSVSPWFAYGFVSVSTNRYTSIRPELCPNLSVSTPALSMIEIIRFDSGMLFAILMCRPS